MKNNVKVSPYIPNTVPENTLYVAQEGKWAPMEDGSFPLMPFAYDTWEKEELSWYDTSYLHAGLNPFMFFEIKGVDYLRMLNDISVSTFNKFPVGKARHTILCTEQGKVLLDGIVVRRSDDEFISMCLPDGNMLNQMNGNKYQFTCVPASGKRFFYQMCGRRSLEIVEAATRQDLHDIKFMCTKDAKIAGKDVFILRTGMAGTLGYEVHGKIEDALMCTTHCWRLANPLEFSSLAATATETAMWKAAFHKLLNILHRRLIQNPSLQVASIPIPI